MAYSEQVKALIRTDYVRGLPLTGAAEKHDVPYQTARNWKRTAGKDGDDWDTARAASRISSGGVRALTAEIIEDFVHLFHATITEIKAAKDIGPMKKAEAISRLSDAYHKTVKASGASNPELARLSIAMDVLQRQADFIRRHFPEKQEFFLEILEPFGMELSRAYGK
ncbi:MAG: DUF1804 family protein [Porticoccaceae bacterium]|nr:DUF1804 family protein [Porticoccaceae bacterium]